MISETRTICITVDGNKNLVDVVIQMSDLYNDLIEARERKFGLVASKGEITIIMQRETHKIEESFDDSGGKD